VIFIIPIEMDYWVARPVRDGNDLDGDCKMGVFNGELILGSLVIRFLE
jgi:hypothetical protein